MLCNCLIFYFIVHAIHFVYLYTNSIRKLFFSNNISLLNTTAYFTCAPIYHMSQRCFHFAKAIFFLQSGISLDVYSFSQFSRSFFSTSGRRIVFSDASTSTSTSSSAALRCLNINPSVEVAGFQLGRRDARGIDTRDKKLPLIASGEVQRNYTSVRSCVCVRSAVSRIVSARIP